MQRVYIFWGAPASRSPARKSLRLQEIVTAMTDLTEHLLICSCDDTMPLDADAVRHVCRRETTTATQLCRAEIDRFRTIAAEDTPLTVACTQEVHLFSEAAAKAGRKGSLQFANIREAAGWSSEAGRAGPKMAALLAAAAEPMPAAPLVKLESAGVILICGRDETAVEAANLLKDHLDVTVLIEPPAAIAPRLTDFPVAKGKVANASGHLGAFEVVVDDFAQALPSSRGVMVFGPSRNHTRSSCDIILDLTGGSPFFPAADLRDGYLRADPGNPAAMLRAVLKARDLTGTFEKPRYITYDATLCARSRWLHPLPRPLSYISDCTGRRSRGYRCEHLRGLRAMRRRLSDRGGLLRVATGRSAHAQAPRPVNGLSRSRWGTGGFADP
jgi:hypothetical protein